MAIKDFTAGLASRAYRNWFSMLRPNVIKEGTTALRERYEKDPERNNFLVSDDTIRDMAAYVTDVATSDISAADIVKIKNRMFASLQNAKNSNAAGDTIDYKIVDSTGNDASNKIESTTVLIVENVNFQTIEAMLLGGFGKGKIDNWKRSVGSGYHRGHVYGLPTVLLRETISSLRKAASLDSDPDDKDFKDYLTANQKTGSAIKDQIIKILIAYQRELRKQDIASSNLTNFGYLYQVYAKYLKKPNSFLIEMQVRKVNTGSGRQAGATLGELKNFLNPGSAGMIQKMTSSLVQPSVILNFLSSPGSPSWITLVGNKIANAIDPFKKSRDEKTYSISPVVVSQTSVKVTRSKKDKDRLKNENIKVTKFIAELRSLDAKAKSIKIQKSTTNLVQLQNLINASLAERIKANMGRGERRDVLNLRTGRFAESAKVERMTQSREGMITAFYSYMKNPYATFSQGGRQDSPKSRDPKLLIAKSIREIAAEQVANRLRSVPV